MMEEDKKNWASFFHKETPFWRDDMTYDEWLEEWRHYEWTTINGKLAEYVPLWKQKEQDDNSNNDRQETET